MGIISNDRLMSLVRELSNRANDSADEKETELLQSAKSALEQVLYLRGINVSN